MVGKRTLFVDLDGVLLDVWDRYQAVHEVLAREGGVDPIPGNAYRAAKMRNLPEREIWESCGLAPSNLESLLAKRGSMLEEPAFLALDRAIPGVFGALRALGLDYRIVVVTLRQDAASLAWQLERLALRPLLDEVLAVGMEGRGGEAKARRMREGSYGPGSLMVGDTGADLEAGRLCGLPAVAVLSGLRDEATLRAQGATIILPGLASLPQYLRDTVSVQGA